jgi:hypothetical protein
VNAKPRLSRIPRRVAWPALAAVATVACCLLGAWATRATLAERCAMECGQPGSLSAGTPDVSRELCNRLCTASVSK